jgi:hypothetical protein
MPGGVGRFLRLIVEQAQKKERALHLILVALSCHSAVRANYGLKRGTGTLWETFRLSLYHLPSWKACFLLPLSDLKGSLTKLLVVKIISANVQL